MASVTTLAKNRKTPGVYVTEFAAFPPSIVGVATAVPIFIGYTETAHDPSSHKQLYLQPVAISSMADYYNYFGYGYDSKGLVAESMRDTTTGELTADYDFEAPSSDGTTAKPKAYLVQTTDHGDVTSSFNLFSAMELFYGNGGGNCFVISVANYWGKKAVDPTPTSNPTVVAKEDLLAGLAVAHDVRGGTMLVVPDACLLVKPPGDGKGYTYPGYQDVVVEMLRQAGTLQDRVAILDMPGALVPANWTYPAMEKEAQDFYTAIGPAADYFSYGCCYGPAVESTLLGQADVDYTNLSTTATSIHVMNNLLTTQALALYPPKNAAEMKKDPALHPEYTQAFEDVAARIAAAFPIAAADITILQSTPPDITGTTGTGSAADPKLQVSMYKEAVYKTPTAAADILTLDQYLVNAVPLLGKTQQILADKLNVVPPSGIMAGIWTQNDATRGFWNAPANYTLNQVVAPKVLLNDEQQGEFNVPLNGEAIDIMRAMVDRGTVVWGARTLLGNSLDYRYIQVRRTLIYIEQSIKQALQQFVFAPNDGGTWATVTATISNFLTQLWQAGGLMGDKASDAFSVKCGVPQTMSGTDVLNGYMIVNVTVQMIHPAEFIELTFTQTMQGV